MNTRAQKPNTSEKVCFVIAPIGEADSATRKRSDQVLRHIIRPAVEELGYKAVRADEIDKPGIITTQVIQHIVDDPLVVADLTERNPNVFYELALRHALRKPLVQLIQKGEIIPFDVAGTRTIYVDHHDLDSVAAARTEIVNQARALERDASLVETPISVALDVQLLRGSQNPEERSLADLVSAVTNVRNTMEKIENKLQSTEGSSALTSIRKQLSEISSRLPRDNSDFQSSPSFIHYLAQTISRGKRDPIGILVIASAVRDDFPWLYDLGLEAYRRARFRRDDASRKIIDDFLSRFRDLALTSLAQDLLTARGQDPYFMRELVTVFEDLFSHTDYTEYHSNADKLS